MTTLRSIRSREELAEFAREHGLRPDWHEPDEQGVHAHIVVGLSFDNAIMDVAVPRNAAESFATAYSDLDSDRDRGTLEHGVVLMVDGEPKAAVNLAVLFALAAGAEQVG
jgi:hypothetical protein